MSPEHGHILCASLRSRIETHVNISQERLYTEIYQAECRRPNPRTTLCASLGSRNALQHVTRATLCKKLQEKCRAPAWAQNADTHFVRACAVEMQGNISQEPLDTEIYRPKVRAQSEHPDQAPAFTLTVRTSQCGHTVWGKNMFSKSVLWGKLDGPIWHIIYDYLPIYNWFSIYTIWSSTILNEKRWFGLPYIIICLSYCLPYFYHINISIIIYICTIYCLVFIGRKPQKFHSGTATACSATASSVTAVAGTSGNGD